MAGSGAVDQNLDPDLDLDLRSEFVKSRLSAVKGEGGDAGKVSLEASHVYSLRGPRAPEGVRLEQCVKERLTKSSYERTAPVKVVQVSCGHAAIYTA